MQSLYFQDFKSSYIPHILKEVYIDKIYEPFLHYAPLNTIVDIGANIGLTAYYFKDYAKRVIAIEPSKQHVDCIEALIKNNKISNIEIYQNAIAAQNGTARFFHNTNVTMFSLRSEVKNIEEFEDVKTVTLEQSFKDLNIEVIDLMKLDVEGSEMDIIVSEGFVAVKDKIKCIVGEFHQWTNVSPHQFANVLRDYGFDFKWLNKTEATTFSAIKI